MPYFIYFCSTWRQLPFLSVLINLYLSEQGICQITALLFDSLLYHHCKSIHRSDTRYDCVQLYCTSQVNELISISKEIQRKGNQPLNKSFRTTSIPHRQPDLMQASLYCDGQHRRLSVIIPIPNIDSNNVICSFMTNWSVFTPVACSELKKAENNIVVF